ncbi:MAG: DnaJ domain-containing protein [Prochloraceae cyanobacterium]|nr:DnaJ domain-containing protein [Prochloraceae cyanobacterium]
MSFTQIDLDKSYKTLKIKKGAPLEEIKASYRKLARKYHPDLNPRNKRAESRFREITQAYQVLSSHYRQQYAPVEELSTQNTKLSINKVVNNVTKAFGDMFKK